MAFDPVHFETTLVDIETHLGYLRGNEVAWAYLEQYPVEVEPTGTLPDDGEGVSTFPVWLDDGYAFPCPDGQYAVTPRDNLLTWAQTHENATFDFDGYVKAVQSNLDQAWANGQAWAQGVAGYARSVCDQFTRPEVATLSAEIKAMQADVVNAILINESNDNWANLGSLYTRWSGDHATAFVNFYDNYNDVEARYGRYLSEVTTGFAMFTSLANATQLGAQSFLDDILDRIKAQLKSWVAQKGKPEKSAELPPWVGDVAAVAKDLLGLATYLPVVGSTAQGVKDVVDKGGQVNTLLKDVDKLSGKSFLPKKTKDIPIETAEQIYTGLTGTLYDDYLGEYDKALDRMNSGSHAGLPDGSNLPAVTFSAQALLQHMNDADDGWTQPVHPGSLAGENDDY